MKKWKKKILVGIIEVCFPTFLFSQTLWVSSLDNTNLNRSVVDLENCYAVEFLLKASTEKELPVEIYLSDIRSRDLWKLKNEESSHLRRVCLTTRYIGDERHLLTVPVDAFDTPKASQGVLRQIRSIVLDVKSEKDKDFCTESGRE